MKSGISNKITKVFSHFLHPGMVFLIDLFLSLAASALTCIIANYLSSSDSFGPSTFLVWMIAALLASSLLYLVTGSYRKIIRHTSMRDMTLFVIIASVKAVLCALAIQLAGTFMHLCPVSSALWVVMLADAFITLCAFSIFRVSVVTVYSYANSYCKITANCKRILVFGIGPKSVAAATRLVKSPHYTVVGYITTDKVVKSLKLHEVPVYTIEDEDSFLKAVMTSDVSAILFTRESELRDVRETIVEYASKAGINVLIAPEIDEVIGGALKRSEIREVKIEELLGRDEIQISMDEIKKFFKDKTVMVTGAAGSIGSELCRQLTTFGVKKLILFDNAETPMHNIRLELEEKFPELNFVPVIGDVRSPERVDFAFRKYKPQVVFHAAAYKHVPLMEENPCEAVRVNVCGSRTIAEKCIEYGVDKMVMISTDKAVNPTNIMGCSKRLAEIYVQSLGKAIVNGEMQGKTHFVTTRFGNVLGSNGSVIPRFREQIAHGGPVTVTHPDINRFFMTIPEACRLVMEAATMSHGNDIFVFDMGTPVKIDSLARKMITLAGFVPDKDIKIEYTGLRPGEKLYEEVLATDENTSASFHKRIRVAHVREYDYKTLLPTFDTLGKLSEDVNIPEMVKLMKKTVPEFKSKNSEFEKYDVQ